MAAGDLTTLVAVKAKLRVTGTGDDAMLGTMITQASQFIQAWLNRTFASASYTETRDGTGTQTMMFANYPVTAVASLTVDDLAVPPASNTTNTGYRFTAHRLHLNNDVFTRGFGNMTVTYTAGYTSTPPEIDGACADFVAYKYRELERIGHSSKSIQSETVAFITADMPAGVKTILNNYRNVVPV
jgi:predicted transglutaminase-like cysteine proteinase